MEVSCILFGKVLSYSITKCLFREKNFHSLMFPLGSALLIHIFFVLQREH